MAIGSIIGFLAVFTSFIALAVDMKSMFRYDYKIPRFFAWLFGYRSADSSLLEKHRRFY